MANNFVVNIEGKDNLSPVLKNIDRENKNIVGSSSNLDKISDRFAKIEASTAPVKKRLREIQGLMTQLNMSGDSNSPLYTQMAEAAGRYKDAIADAATATKQFSNDTMSLQAAVSAIQGIASVGTIATGVMGLFGAQNEQVTQTILKVQSALAILNGVQSIANVLNKDSILMLKLKSIQQKISTSLTQKSTIAQKAENVAKVVSNAETTGSTTALAANTVAKVANTASTTASTVAQNAWNVAKAVAKALLGDFTGLVLVGATALGAFALSTSKSTDETNEQSAALKKQKEIMNSYNESVQRRAEQMITSYTQLREEFSKLKTESEKIEWIKKSQSAFKALGLQINSVTQAERAFFSNNRSMLNALMIRASMDALEDLAAQHAKNLAADLLRNKNTVEGGGFRHEVKAGHEYGWDSAWGKAIREAAKAKGDYVPEHTAGMHTGNYYTVKGGNIIPKANIVSAANEITKREANERKAKNDQEAYNRYEKGIEDIRTVRNDMEALAKKLFGDLYYEGSSDQITIPDIYDTHVPKPKGGTPSVSDEIPPKEGSLEYWKKLREEQEKILNTNAPDSEAFKQAAKKWVEYDDKVKEVEKTLDGFKTKKEEILEGTLAALDEKIKEETKILNNFTKNTPQADIDAQKEIIRKLQDERKDLAEKLKIEIDKKEKEYTIEVKTEPEDIDVDSIWNKRASLSNAQTIIDQTKFDLKNGIITADEAQAIIDDINEKLQSLGLKPLNLEIDIDTGEIEDELERFQKKWDEISDISDSVGEIGNAFSSLGSAIEGTTGKILSFGGAVISQGTQMVQQLAQIIVANEAAALAKGAESASGLAFPFNLAAIATVVATIAGIFASFPKFADGGIVSGTTFHGDRLFARVNAGEMILNQRQQSNLYRVLNSNNSKSSGGSVHFEISGDKLIGVMNNYNKKTNKIR